jgi:hypothetical protein
MNRVPTSVPIVTSMRSIEADLLTTNLDSGEDWDVEVDEFNCLMRGTIGDVAQAPRGSEFAARLLEEIVAVVEAVGVAPSPEFIAAAKAGLTATGSTQTSSMYRDLQRGVPIEADQIIGDLVERARSTTYAIVFFALWITPNRLNTYDAGTRIPQSIILWDMTLARVSHKV